jgi:hypothetical protein
VPKNSPLDEGHGAAGQFDDFSKKSHVFARKWAKNFDFSTFFHVPRAGRRFSFVRCKFQSPQGGGFDWGLPGKTGTRSGTIFLHKKIVSSLFLPEKRGSQKF